MRLWNNLIEFYIIKLSIPNSQLFNDSLATLSSAISKDENNAAVSGNAWTGTTTTQCDGGGGAWTSSSSGLQGAVGNSAASNSGWLSGSADTCDGTRRLYCIGQ